VYGCVVAVMTQKHLLIAAYFANVEVMWQRAGADAEVTHLMLEA
jgi:hypothetical protein